MAQDVVLTDVNFVPVGKMKTVKLSVLTGDDQVSGTALLLNGQPHPFANPEGPSLIGKGKDLIGGVLHVMTTVRDVNPLTNRTSVTYTLADSKTRIQFPFAIEVSADKGAAHYVITFIFEA